MPRISFNPFSNTFDLVGDSGGPGPGPGADFYVEQFVLSPAEATAKSVTLANAPTNAARTVLIIKGAGGQYYGDGFIVSGTTLSWNGLELDGVLEAGDRLSIIHN
jgi:hypothetical protein